MSYKLFIPGPVEVSEKTYKAMATPIMGHRSKDFVKLVEDVMPRLKQLFYTEDPVFLSTSSSWGVMEGAVRNVVKKGVLNCCNGAFSDKWYDVSKRCGKNAGELKFDWGKPGRPRSARKRALHRQVRRRHDNPQRDLHRNDERHQGHFGSSQKIPRRCIDSRHRELLSRQCR